MEKIEYGNDSTQSHHHTNLYFNHESDDRYRVTNSDPEVIRFLSTGIHLELNRAL